MKKLPLNRMGNHFEFPAPSLDLRSRNFLWLILRVPYHGPQLLWFFIVVFACQIVRCIFTSKWSNCTPYLTCTNLLLLVFVSSSFQAYHPASSRARSSGRLKPFSATGSPPSLARGLCHLIRGLLLSPKVYYPHWGRGCHSL